MFYLEEVATSDCSPEIGERRIKNGYLFLRKSNSIAGLFMAGMEISQRVET